MEIDRPMLLPPGTPPERVAALRKAFHETMIDPAFVAEAKKENIEISEISGEGVQQIIETAYSLPSDVVQTAKDSMGTGGGE